MDSLTQIVLGAAVGEVVLGRKIGNKAVFWGAFAGTIPDLDVFVNLFVEDKLTATLMHRAFTHSFLFCLLIPPIFAKFFVVLFKKSKANFKDWFLLFFFGFLTHMLLDVQTTYGTQLLWPNNSRLAISNIFVVDPLYTIPFMFFLILAIRLKKDNPKRRKYNNLGIYISTFYLLLTFIFKGIAYYNFTNNLKDQNISYQRVETSPTPLNSFLWIANVETEDAYYIANYSLFDKREKIPFKRIEKNITLRNELKNYYNFKRLNHFSKDFYTVNKDKKGFYTYNNLRFGMLSFDDEERDFVFKYKLKINNEKLEVFQNRSRSDNETSNFSIKQFFKKLINRIKGI